MKLDLAEIKKRFQPQTAVAITIESDRVVVDLVRLEGGGLKTEQSLTLPFGADYVIKNSEAAGKKLAEGLEAAGIKERRCVVCIPPGWAQTASAELPEVSAEDLRGYLELRAEREFPIPVSELRIAYCSYFLPDGMQRATLAAIPTRRLDVIEKMLAGAGCRAVSISLGLERCLSGPSSAVHFLASGDHVDVVVTAGGGIVLLRTLEAAPADEAHFDAAGFCREIRITLGRLPEPIRQLVREARFEGAQPAAEKLCRQTHDQIVRMGLNSPDCAEIAARPASAAVEAAGSHLREKPLPFEFVVLEANKWEAAVNRFNTKRYRLISTAAAVFIGVPLILFMWRSHKESALQSQWENMRKNVADLDVLQQKIRQFQPWFDPTPRSLQEIEGLVSVYPEQGEVWAKGVQLGEDGKVTSTGFARNEAALAALLDRVRARTDTSNVQLVQRRGNNPIQFSFTYKWAQSHEK